MFITIIFLIILLVIFTALNIKKRHIYVIAVYLTSIAFMLFIATIYISKVNYYKFPLGVDYLIYLKVSSIRIPISTLKTLYNLSFSSFMLASLNTAKQFLKLEAKTLILSGLPICAFLLLTDPSICNELFLYQQTLGEIDIIKITHVLCGIILVVYSLLPFACIIKYYSETKFKANKHSAIILLLCIAAINIYFYSVFIFGNYKYMLFSNVNPIGVPIEPFSASNYITVSIITFFLLTPSAILLIIFRPFNLFSFEYTKNKDIKKNVHPYNSHFIANLHTYKNMFWGAQQQFELIRVAMQAKDYDAVVKYADNGINLTNQHIRQLGHTMNSFSQDNSLYEDVNIVACLEEAFKKSTTKSDVTIVKNYRYSNIYTFGNKHLLTEAFYNIIINSLESFGPDNSNPTLTATVEFEDNMCLIELSDNGCGISHKNLKKIFEPFYSTKSQSDNFGVGLNFVKKIVKSYHGTIIVSSKPNKYTTFQITIPFSTLRGLNING